MAARNEPDAGHRGRIGQNRDACGQSFEGVGAGAKASNDRKPAIRGVVSGGPIPLPTAQPFEPKTLVEYGTNST